MDVSKVSSTSRQYSSMKRITTNFTQNQAFITKLENMSNSIKSDASDEMIKARLRRLSCASSKVPEYVARKLRKSIDLKRLGDSKGSNLTMETVSDNEIFPYNEINIDTNDESQIARNFDAHSLSNRESDLEVKPDFERPGSILSMTRKLSRNKSFVLSQIKPEVRKAVPPESASTSQSEDNMYDLSEITAKILKTIISVSKPRSNSYEDKVKMAMKVLKDMYKQLSKSEDDLMYPKEIKKPLDVNMKSDKLRRSQVRPRKEDNNDKLDNISNLSDASGKVIHPNTYENQPTTFQCKFEKEALSNEDIVNILNKILTEIKELSSFSERKFPPSKSSTLQQNLIQNDFPNVQNESSLDKRKGSFLDVPLYEQSYGTGKSSQYLEFAGSQNEKDVNLPKSHDYIPIELKPTYTGSLNTTLRSSNEFGENGISLESFEGNKSIHNTPNWKETVLPKRLTSESQNNYENTHKRNDPDYRYLHSLASNSVDKSGMRKQRMSKDTDGLAPKYPWAEICENRDNINTTLSYQYSLKEIPLSIIISYVEDRLSRTSISDTKSEKKYPFQNESLFGGELNKHTNAKSSPHRRVLSHRTKSDDNIDSNNHRQSLVDKNVGFDKQNELGPSKTTNSGLQTDFTSSQIVQTDYTTSVKRTPQHQHISKNVSVSTEMSNERVPPKAYVRNDIDPNRQLPAKESLNPLNAACNCCCQHRFDSKVLNSGIICCPTDKPFARSWDNDDETQQLMALCRKYLEKKTNEKHICCNPVEKTNFCQSVNNNISNKQNCQIPVISSNSSKIPIIGTERRYPVYPTFNRFPDPCHVISNPCKTSGYNKPTYPYSIGTSKSYFCPDNTQRLQTSNVYRHNKLDCTDAIPQRMSNDKCKPCPQQYYQCLNNNIFPKEYPSHSNEFTSLNRGNMNSIEDDCNAMGKVSSSYRAPGISRGKLEDISKLPKEKLKQAQTQTFSQSNTNFNEELYPNIRSVNQLYVHGTCSGVPKSDGREGAIKPTNTNQSIIQTNVISHPFVGDNKYRKTLSHERVVISNGDIVPHVTKHIREISDSCSETSRINVDFHGRYMNKISEKAVIRITCNEDHPRALITSDCWVITKPCESKNTLCDNSIRKKKEIVSKKIKSPKDLSSERDFNAEQKFLNNELQGREFSFETTCLPYHDTVKYKSISINQCNNTTVSNIHKTSPWNSEKVSLRTRGVNDYRHLNPIEDEKSFPKTTGMPTICQTNFLKALFHNNKPSTSDTVNTSSVSETSLYVHSHSIGNKLSIATQTFATVSVCSIAESDICHCSEMIGSSTDDKYFFPSDRRYQFREY